MAELADQMITTFKIKDLTHRAIVWLEEAYFRAHPVCSATSANRVTNLNSLALSQRAIADGRLSPLNSTASLVTNVVNRQTIEQKIPTLLISSQPSLTQLAVNLVLWRAGIQLNAVIDSAWTDSEFARLTVACGEVAQAPLLVACTIPLSVLKKSIGSAVAQLGLRCLVVDNPPYDSLTQWHQISCEFGLPIRLISSAV